MGEVIRIPYRSKEKGVDLLNSKAGDFGSYSLPRLSVHNWEEEVAHRNESVNGNSSDLSSKPKVRLKPPCFKHSKGIDDVGVQNSEEKSRKLSKVV